MITKQKLAVLAGISEDLAQLILDEVKQSVADDLHDLYDDYYGCPEEQAGISAAASNLDAQWWD
jgi:hypothetical protein